MATLSEHAQRQIIHDCFNGHVERKCSTCPAHHLRGGVCCFGDPDEYDDDDEQSCQKCTFQEECRQDVIDEEAEAQHQHTQNHGWRPAPKPVSPTYSRFVSTGRTVAPNPNRLVQIGGTRQTETETRRASVITPPNKVRQPVDQPTERLFVRFWKDSVWGMGQGFFEMAAEFFRTHRLP